MKREVSQFSRGDVVVYRFEGEAAAVYPGLAHQPFFKIVRGLPGDLVLVEGRDVYVDGQWVGTARAHAFDRRPLAPISPTVIPPGHFYAQGSAPDSFDSRYASSGLVRFDQVIGKVVPLL
jgi:conjugal transfer pilin signal peptidase TrbI